MKNLFLLFITSIGFAQVGINTENPDPSSSLDIKSSTTGILIPRLTSNEIKNIIQPANALMVYDLTKKCLSQNIGTKDLPEWFCLNANTNKSFYMPSIPFETSSSKTAQQKDLYSLYIKQFATPLAKSPSSPSAVPYYLSKQDLFYYILDADTKVFKNIKIDDNGIMTYDVVANATDYTFINILFVVK
ncbi:hypothetical protein [Empedobacter brevis]|uniref:hypothetical protein n=1 Tax=Empedobacter brevis TaxID=247 RepID=UPI0028A8C418|nr:hypothetical protein [Empedobacter brevis]